MLAHYFGTWSTHAMLSPLQTGYAPERICHCCTRMGALYQAASITEQNEWLYTLLTRLVAGSSA